MARQQNSSKGFHVKSKIQGTTVGVGGTHELTANSSAILSNAGIRPKNLTAAPATRYGPGALVYVTNSTGSMLAVNTTATTWKYTTLTSVLA